MVLDEAQAIKNSSTASAKAVRLLRGKHRLALSGTPVENHLGELWSLFEFLNPGHARGGAVLQDAGGMARNPSEEAAPDTRPGAAAVHPAAHQTAGGARTAGKDRADHILRTGGPQRKHYEELRKHYRASLLERVRSKASAEIENARAGGAAAVAPGGLPSRPARLEARRRTERQTRHPTGTARRNPRGRPQSAGIFAIHQPARHRAAATGRADSPLRISRRRTTNRQAHVERFRTTLSAGCS